MSPYRDEAASVHAENQRLRAENEKLRERLGAVRASKGKLTAPDITLALALTAGLFAFMATISSAFGEPGDAAFFLACALAMATLMMLSTALWPRIPKPPSETDKRSNP